MFLTGKKINWSKKKGGSANFRMNKGIGNKITLSLECAKN